MRAFLATMAAILALPHLAYSADSFPRARGQDHAVARFAAGFHRRDAAPCATPPENGAVLEGGNDNPFVEFNKLAIENGSLGNAIVKLRDAETNKLFVSFYVVVNQAASYAYIPDGRYVVQYAFGDKLDRACTAFLSLRRAARNPQIETFPVDASGTRQVLNLKLFPVPKGNLKPQPIDEVTFNAE